MNQPEQESKILEFPEGGKVVKADTEEGYTRIANTLLKSLYQCDLTGRQFRVMLAIIRKTYGFGQKLDWITSTQLAQEIDYRADTSNIRRDLIELKMRRLIIEEGKKIGPNPIVSTWYIRKCVENNTCRKQHAPVSKSTHHRVESNTESVSKTTHTKEKRNLSKETNTKEKESSRIPYDEILNLYHEILPTLPRVAKLTSARKSQIQARWKSGDIGDLDEWRDYFEHVKKSRFLMGLIDPVNGRKRFQANLEWLTKEANFVKVWENHYHGEK